MPADLFGWLRGRLRSNPSGTGQDTQPGDPLSAQARDLVECYVAEWLASNTPAYDLRPADFPSACAILKAGSALQIACIHAALPRLMRSPQLSRIGGRYVAPDLATLQPLLRQLLLRQLPYTATDLERILAVLAGATTTWAGYVPLHAVLKHVERQAAAGGLTPGLRRGLERLHETGAKRAGTDAERKALGLIDRLLGLRRDEGAGIDPADDWGRPADEALEQMAEPERAAWVAILDHARTAEAARPPKVWLVDARRRIDAMGRERFKAQALDWLGFLSLPSRNDFYQDGTAGGKDNDGRVPSSVITAANAQLLKGLIWCCGAAGEDEALAQALGRAAEACYRKVAWYGARSPRAGNACVQALSLMPGPHGVAQLQRLRQRVRYPSALRLIDGAFEAAARRQGLRPEDMEELAVPTYGLEEGCLRWEMGRYTAEVTVRCPAEVEIRWLRPDGTPQRGEPAEVRREAAGDLKDLRRTVDDLRKMLPAQRDRIEAFLRTDRAWPCALWRERYLDQPLLSLLARRLIWQLEEGDRRSAGAWHDGDLRDLKGDRLAWLSDATAVRLWHPLEATPDEALAWQLWLEERKVTQPFKQAHREIYALTDAERSTEFYSNRFAAHILRQHQFHALCRERGWTYRLQGGFDSANTPTLALPQWGLQAEFWVDGVGQDDESFSESNIYLHVSTDQVRFANMATHEPVPLVQVPPRLFSEVMRDVDLFVGVCSIGNDPSWYDRGPDGHRAYWHEYAFGELSVTAQNRRALLARILPGLAIAGRCSLDDRALVVRGDLRTYRIHLGSGNIQMEPNNQYLCIVAARGEGSGQGSLYLPFDGDSTLAIILSKAFLLATDRSIKDPTITRQIRGR